MILESWGKLDTGRAGKHGKELISAQSVILAAYQTGRLGIAKKCVSKYCDHETNRKGLAKHTQGRRG